MSENARKRLAADFRLMGYTEGGAQRQRNDLLTADPQLEADIEAGAALNSDKAERVLGAAMRHHHIGTDGETIRAILDALREGLRDE